MNARLIESTPDALHLQADACSAVGMLFLETSGKYFEMQMSAIKDSLNSFRSELNMSEPSADAQQIMAKYTAVLAKSVDQSNQLLRQSLELSAESQRQLNKLLDQSWLNIKDIAQQTSALHAAFTKNTSFK